jgi:hypothetical protein
VLAGVLVWMLVLQMVQRVFSSDAESLVGLITSGLLAAGVMESFGRVVYLTVRARSAVRQD